MSNIILARRDISDPFSCKFAGLFRLRTRKIATGKLVEDTGWFKNLILDAGLNRIGTGAIVTHVQVGSGSATPLVTDTTLSSLIANTSTNNPEEPAVNNYSPIAPYYGYYRRNFRFDAGVAAGTIAEIGTGWAAAGSLWSRSLILDSGGSPTTLTVLSDEVLDVSYELRHYVPMADAAFAVTIGGVTYNCTVRAANATSTEWSPASMMGSGRPGSFPQISAHSGSIGAITGTPSGTVAGGPNGIWSAYSNNSLENEVNWSIGLTQMNVPGGIKSMRFNTGQYFGTRQVEFDVPVPKDNTKVMTLKGKFSWDRFTIP